MKSNKRRGVKLITGAGQPPSLMPSDLWNNTSVTGGAGLSDGTDHDHDMRYEPMTRMVRHEARFRSIHGVRDIRSLLTAGSLGFDVRHAWMPTPVDNRTAQTLTDGTLFLTYLRPNHDVKIGHLFSETAGTAAIFGGSPYLAYAVFDVDAQSTLTQVATTGDIHATAGYNLSNATRVDEPPVTTPYTFRAGYLAAVGILAVGQTTPAVIYGSNVGKAGTIAGAHPAQAGWPVLSQCVTGQTTMPTSITASSLLASSVRMWIGYEE